MQYIVWFDLEILVCYISHVSVLSSFINIQVRVDVGARNAGKVQAALTETDWVGLGAFERATILRGRAWFYEPHFVFLLLLLPWDLTKGRFCNLCSLYSFVWDKETFQHNVSCLMVSFMVIVMFLMSILVENMVMYSICSFVLLRFQACLCCELNFHRVLDWQVLNPLSYY